MKPDFRERVTFGSRGLWSCSNWFVELLLAADGKILFGSSQEAMRLAGDLAFINLPDRPVTHARACGIAGLCTDIIRCIWTEFGLRVLPVCGKLPCLSKLVKSPIMFRLANGANAAAQRLHSPFARCVLQFKRLFV